MATQLSSGELIANRYASALYDLSLEGKCVDLVLSDLLIIQKYIDQNKDFNLLVASPLITSSEKLIVFKKILDEHSANVLTLNFIKVISNNKRFNSLASIISRYKAINAEKRGDIIADIISADELSDQQKGGINDQLCLILGKKLFLNFKVNNKIIGGLIVKVGSKMIDSSLATKINKLKIAMEET